MTAPASHHPVIPAPLLKPPPRQVRLRRQAFSRNRGSIFLAIFFALMGLGFLAFAIADVLFISHAPLVTGHVVDKTIGKSSKGNPTYHLYYSFRVGPDVYSSSESVGTARYHAESVGSPISINTANILGRHYDEIHLSTSEYWDDRGAFWVIGLIFLGGTLFALTAICLTSRNLVRYGTPVIGVVTEKHTRTSTRSASTTYYVTCQFTDPTREARFKKFAVNQAGYNSIHQHEQVVILCNSNNPARGQIYKCGLYEAI